MAVFIPNTVLASLRLSWTASATQDMTLMCWVTLGATTGNYRNIITTENLTGANVAFQTFTDGVTFDIGTGTSDNLGSVLPLNTWLHLTYYVRPSSSTNRQIVGFINGKENIRVIDTSTFAAVTGITIGNWAFGQTVPYDLPVNGTIRDVRIWTRVLTPTEIQTEYSSAVPVNKQALLIWSPFDDELVNDKSGNGHKWTAGGLGEVLRAGPRPAWPARISNFGRR